MARYKESIRPVMRDGLVFHHTPFLPLAEPTPWCVLEYAAPDQSASVTALFRTSAAGADAYQFHPRGLHPGRVYTVSLDNTGETFSATGRELAQTGIQVRLEQALLSEMVVIRE